MAALVKGMNMGVADLGTGVGCAGHCGFQADGSLVNKSQKHRFRSRGILGPSKNSVRLHEGNAPCRDEKCRQQLRVRIVGAAADGLGQRRSQELSEFIAYGARPRPERLACLERLHEALASTGKPDVGPPFFKRSMRELAQSFNGRHARIALLQCQDELLAPVFIEIEEHVLLTREMIEHRHASHIGGFRNLIHRDLIEAPHMKEARCCVGDGLSRGQAFAGSTVERR